jgi:acyl-CoA thioester hydrolase
MTKTDFRHFYDLAVRWADMDSLGHVNNAELIRYLECGRVAYCADVLNFSFYPGLPEGWILAELSCTYHRQLQYPATVTVATRCSRLGGRSGELSAALYRQGSEELLSSSRAVIVWFNYQQQCSVPIPDTVRMAIKAYEVTAPNEA